MVMLMFTNNDENNGNSGNRGKFSDSIKKIRRDLFKKSKITLPSEEKEFILDSTRTNVFKVFLSIPLIVYNNVFNK